MAEPRTIEVDAVSHAHMHARDEALCSLISALWGLLTSQQREYLLGVARDTQDVDLRSAVLLNILEGT